MIHFLPLDLKIYFIRDILWNNQPKDIGSLLLLSKEWKEIVLNTLKKIHQEFLLNQDKKSNYLFTLSWFISDYFQSKKKNNNSTIKQQQQQQQFSIWWLFYSTSESKNFYEGLEFYVNIIKTGNELKYFLTNRNKHNPIAVFIKQYIGMGEPIFSIETNRTSLKSFFKKIFPIIIKKQQEIIRFSIEINYGIYGSERCSLSDIHMEQLILGLKTKPLRDPFLYQLKDFIDWIDSLHNFIMLRKQNLLQ